MSWLRPLGIASIVLGTAAFLGCGADGMDGASDMGDPNASADELEIGSTGEALMSCTNPDGTNAAMAAFAVAVAQDLGRWNVTKDFQKVLTSGRSESSPGAQQAIKLTSGRDSSGAAIGKSRCSDGKCAHVQAILDMQYDQANNLVYFQGSGKTKVLLNPAALRSRMYAKWQEQASCDASARDGNNSQCTKEQHVLKFAGTAKGGCDTNFTFSATSASGAKLKYPNQLKNELRFADATNPYINFKNLGNGKISIDPTYGLNDDGVSTVGSCTAACTKISTTSYSGKCCSCAGKTKKFSKASFNSTLFLCL